MTYNSNNKRGWLIFFEILTPFLLIMLTWINSANISRFDKIDKVLECIDNRIFSHLTNDEIHYPKSSIATKEEFQMYTGMRDRQWSELYIQLNNIKTLLIEIKNRNR